MIRQSGDTFHVQKGRANGGDFALNEEVAFPDYTPDFCQHNRSSDPGYIRTIIVDATPDDKILWLTQDQIIVPRAVVAGNESLLTLLNEHRNFFRFSDLNDLFDPQLQPAALANALRDCA